MVPRCPPGSGVFIHRLRIDEELALHFLNDLYNGKGKKSVFFRLGLVAFDVVTIGFFILTSMVELSPTIIAIDLVIAFFLSLDFFFKIVARPKIGSIT